MQVTLFNDLAEASSARPTVSERIIFLSDHGNSCRLFSAPPPPLSEIIEMLIERLPAKKFYFHFSGCELISPNCTNLFSLIGVDPRILGVSGYGKSLSVGTAAKLDEETSGLLKLNPDYFIGAKRSYVIAELAKRIDDKLDDGDLLFDRTMKAQSKVVPRWLESGPRRIGYKIKSESLVTIDPRGFSKPESRQEAWSESELSCFLNFHSESPRLPLYLLAANVPCRIGELFGLKKSDVDFENKVIHIQRSYDQKAKALTSTKTKTKRFVHLPDAITNYLLQHFMRTESEFVLPRNLPGLTDTKHASRVLRRDCIKAGVRPIRFRLFRVHFPTTTKAQLNQLVTKRPQFL